MEGYLNSPTSGMNSARDMEDVTMQHEQGTSLLERFLNPAVSADGKKKGTSMHRKIADMIAPLLTGSKSPRSQAAAGPSAPAPKPAPVYLKTAVSTEVPVDTPIPAVHNPAMLSTVESSDIASLPSVFETIRTKQSLGAQSDTSLSSQISGQGMQHAVTIHSELSTAPVASATTSTNTPHHHHPMSVDIPSTPTTPVTPAAAPVAPSAPALLTPQLDRLLKAARHCTLPASPRAEPPPGSPAGTPNQTTLLALSNTLPPRMARAHWCLSDYVIGDKLYTGYASTVYKAICKHTGETVVLKIYTLAAVCDLYKYQIYREVRVHASLQHENIVTLFAAFQEGDRIIMVQEYADGRDLFTLLHKYGGRLSERLAVQLVLDPFLRVLHYLHTRAIIHRDIKPENILFTKNMVLKLGDFGLAIDLREERAVTRAGTLDYMAPEVLRCPYKSRPEENKEKDALHYGARVDAWAVGVLTFELLAGYPPFFDQSRTNTEQHIVGKTPEFPAGISEEAKSFISWALLKSATDRPTIHEMLQHTWVEQYRARRSMRAMPSGERSSAPTESAAQAVRAAVNTMQAASAKARVAAAQTSLAANTAMHQAMSVLQPGMMIPFPGAPAAVMMAPIQAVPVMPHQHLGLPCMPASKPPHLTHLVSEDRVASAPSTPHCALPISHACAHPKSTAPLVNGMVPMPQQGPSPLGAAPGRLQMPVGAEHAQLQHLMHPFHAAGLKQQSQAQQPGRLGVPSFLAQYGDANNSMQP